jgi:hypothetical protein
MNLTYIVELKDWDNIDSYPQVYNGNSLTNAMTVFKEYHLKGEDVILFIEDEKGNTIDTLENYGQIDNIIKCNELFPQSDKELKKQHKEAITQKEIYNRQYNDQLNENIQLSKHNERLQRDNRELRQQLNKVNENNKETHNNVFWYEYRLRGFSPFCQPKGHIDHNPTMGRHGIIAYNRQLTEHELNEYELKLYNKAI